MEFNVIEMRILNFLISKLNNTNVKIKKVLNGFLFNPKDPQKGLEMFESYFINNYLITSESLSHYIHGTKPPTKRKLLCWFINLIAWINFIKYLLLYMIKDKWIWMVFGEPFYLFEKRDLPALFFSIVCLGVALQGIISE